jgi:Zn-dependent protease with chaperone function
MAAKTGPQIPAPGQRDDTKGTCPMTVSRTPAAVAHESGLPEAEADRVLAGLLPRVDGLEIAVRAFTAAGLAAAGAGVVLAGPAVAVACAAGIGAWLCLCGVVRLMLAAVGRAGQVARAAAVHAAVLPGRVPSGTLAAAGRHLPAVAAARGRRGRAWLYVAACPGPGRRCSQLCAAVSALPLGRRVLVVLGEHPAARPDVAAALLAHEAGHHASRWLRLVREARNMSGWGWAAAGLAGAAIGGRPGAAIAGAVFWLVSLAALWAGETRCDLRAVRAEGHPAAEAGFGYLADVKAGRVPARPSPAPSRSRRAGTAVLTVLDWAAGPEHPPIRLRRALVAVLARQENR